MSDPLFSIILPTYNRAAMTRQAVRSVLWQDCPDYDLWVVDDGSTDETPEVAREFSGNPRVIWTRFASNRGQHVCRNHALRLAQGRYISFLDSDDLYLPRRLRMFRSAIETRPTVQFWFSSAYLYRYGRVIGRVFDPVRPIPEGRLPGYYAVGGRYLPYLTTNVAISRKAFEVVGLFREDLKVLEDTELYARMLAAGVEVGVVRECLAVRRLHEGQITQDYARDFAEAIEAFRSGGSPEDVLVDFCRALAKEVAQYYLKDLQPRKARRLLQAMGHRGTVLYWATYTPRVLLGWLKACRRIWISARPRFGREALEFTRVEEMLRSLECWLESRSGSSGSIP